MLNPNTFPDLARNAVAAVALAGWMYVIVDALGKMADAPALKKELDLKEGQISARIVAECETVMITALSSATTVDVDENLNLETRRVALSDEGRDKLGEVLRRNESAFSELRRIRGLPNAIRRLNAAVYWAALMVAVLSTGVALVLSVRTMSLTSCADLLVLSCSSVLVPGGLAVWRHILVQDAEAKILKNYARS